MTVSRRKETRLGKCIVHRTADVRGGVSVITKELSGDILYEGTPLSKPDATGTCHVVKFAKVHSNAAASDTTVKVYKRHHLKVNDIVFASEGGAAAKVTGIDSSNANYDELTLSAAVGALTAGTSFLCQGAAEGTTGAALKYAPFCIAGTNRVVEQGTNINEDAWIIGVTHGNDLPAVISGKLRLIENY